MVSPCPPVVAGRLTPVHLTWRMIHYELRVFWRFDILNYIGFTIENSNNKIFWIPSLKPIYSILCGDLTATMSQNSTTVYL